MPNDVQLYVLDAYGYVSAAAAFALTRLSTHRVGRSLKEWMITWSKCAEFAQHEGLQVGAWADFFYFHAIMSVANWNPSLLDAEDLLSLVDASFMRARVCTSDDEQSISVGHELGDILALSASIRRRRLSPRITPYGVMPFNIWPLRVPRHRK